MLFENIVCEPMPRLLWLLTSQNLYALLGNDVEDASVVEGFPKEVTKKTTSSKKADVPPASADPSKANKNKKKATGNEAAVRSKNQNRSKEGPGATPNKHQKKPFDKQSRRNTDSKKKVKQGWGETAKAQADGETEGAKDAEAEVQAEVAPAAPAKPQGKSLADYFEELKVKQASLEGTATLRTANEGGDKWADAEKIEKEQEEFISATHVKASKQKKNKEKKFLDFNAVFADSARPASKGGKKTQGGKKASKIEINDENFPSL